MGGTAAGARVRGGAELSGNGPAGGVVDGQVGCAGGFAGGVEGPGEDKSWGVFGMDWYVLPFPYLYDSILMHQQKTQMPEISLRMLTLSLFRLVIILIAAEILVAAINIVVDLYAGVD